MGVKQVYSRLIFKGHGIYFGKYYGSTQRRIISCVSQVLLWVQKTRVGRVSSNPVSTKSSTTPIKSINRFLIETSRPTKRVSPFGMVCRTSACELRIYNNKKATGNIHGSIFIRTSGKPKRFMLGTMAETRKNFYTKSGEKDNELAIPEDLKLRDEYINFIKNDKKLFERAVSAEALIKAWYQQKSKPGMGTPGTNKETLTGIKKL